MSEWSPVTSAERSGLGPDLFTIIAGDMDSGIECTSASCVNLMKLSKAKC